MLYPFMKEAQQDRDVDVSIPSHPSEPKRSDVDMDLLGSQVDAILADPKNPLLNRMPAWVRHTAMAVMAAGSLSACSTTGQQVSYSKASIGESSRTVEVVNHSRYENTDYYRMDPSQIARQTDAL